MAQSKIVKAWESSVKPRGVGMGRFLLRLFVLIVGSFILLIGVAWAFGALWFKLPVAVLRQPLAAEFGLSAIAALVFVRPHWRAMVTLLNKFRPVTLCLLVLVTACSSVQTGQQSSAVSGPNLATVYFYRPHNSPGAAVGVDIKDNGIDIGTLQEGTYFVYHTNPRQHALTATTDTASTQNFELQAGAIYYMKAGVVSHQHLFQSSLSVVFDLQGQSAIQNLQRLGCNE